MSSPWKLLILSYPHPSLSTTPGSPPPENWIKLNVDAALSNSKASLAVVARDHNSLVINVWARLVRIHSLLQDEADAFLWAFQLSNREHRSHVIFKDDAKACFDSLSSTELTVDLSIHATLSNILSLAECFVDCSSIWVKRICNSVAHAAAKFA